MHKRYTLFNELYHVCAKIEFNLKMSTRMTLACLTLRHQTTVANNGTTLRHSQEK